MSIAVFYKAISKNDTSKINELLSRIIIFMAGLIVYSALTGMFLSGVVGLFPDNNFTGFSPLIFIGSALLAIPMLMLGAFLCLYPAIPKNQLLNPETNTLMSRDFLSSLESFFFPEQKSLPLNDPSISSGMIKPGITDTTGIPLVHPEPGIAHHNAADSSAAPAAITTPLAMEVSAAAP